MEGAVDLSEDRLHVVVDLALFIPRNEGKIAGRFVSRQKPRDRTILIPVCPILVSRTLVLYFRDASAVP